MKTKHKSETLHISTITYIGCGDMASKILIKWSEGRVDIESRARIEFVFDLFYALLNSDD